MVPELTNTTLQATVTGTRLAAVTAGKFHGFTWSGGHGEICVGDERWGEVRSVGKVGRVGEMGSVEEKGSVAMGRSGEEGLGKVGCAGSSFRSLHVSPLTFVLVNETGNYKVFQWRELKTVQYLVEVEVI